MSFKSRQHGLSWVDVPVEHRNRLGQSRFQPALTTGERLWLERGWGGQYSTWLNKAKLEKAAEEHRKGKGSKKTPPRPTMGLEPYLTSYKRAKRLAEAQGRRKYREMYIDDYKEVS